MLLAVFVACVSAAAFVVAATRLRAVAKLMPNSPGTLRAALRARDQEAVEGALQSLFPAKDFEHDLLTSALLHGSSTNAHAAVAALNEHLGDVARELAVARTVPRAMARVALAAGTFAAVLQITMSSPFGAAWASAMGEFLAGCVGAGAAFEMDRRSRALGDRVRAGWDEVAALCERRLRPPGAAGQE